MKFSRSVFTKKLRVPSKARRPIRRIKRVARDNMLYFSNQRELWGNTVLYESFDGTGQLCHPEAVFRRLIERKDTEHLQHIWVVREGFKDRPMFREFAKRRSLKVSFVVYGTKAYFEALGSAKFLINNSTFPKEFCKREGQIYLNTWHGIPLKAMGYDIPAGGPDTRNVVRNLLAADFVLSSGPFMTRRIWGEAFKLAGVIPGKVLEVGSPRIDVQLRLKDDEAELREALADCDFRLDDRKIVLIAPTWRGSTPYSVDDEGDKYLDLAERLEESLGSSSYRVLLKVHQLVHRGLQHNQTMSDRLISNDIPVNVLLAATSHLVTDYSSLAFDFLLSDKPLHFYLPEDDYLTSRGVYEEIGEFPGPIAHDVFELAHSIKTYQSVAQTGFYETFDAQRQNWISKYLPLEDGGATDRVIDAIFGFRRVEGIRSLSGTAARPKVLLHVGSLIANGITVSAINTANMLAEIGYDVSVVYPFSNDGFKRSKSLEFHETVRLFPRVGEVAIPWRYRRAYRTYLRSGGSKLNSQQLEAISSIFNREWRRCFGNAEFETIIAFDGYSIFWAELLLRGHAKRKYIWAHNDLAADAHREIRGHKPHFYNLTSLFTLYRQFDKVVSVSDDLKRINQKKLGVFADDEAFVAVRNSIDYETVRARAQWGTPIKLIQESPKFVTVGRLSPEKNQARILRAFREVCSRVQTAHLYVVGGGPLEGELRALALNLGISQHVTFTGFQSNPHPIVKACDCFVFASNYEGQGLAVLEAMSLGLPIVTTEYNVVHSVVGPEDGLITAPTDEGLAAGMLAFVNGGAPSPIFDPERFNSEAAQELRLLMNY